MISRKEFKIFISKYESTKNAIDREIENLAKSIKIYEKKGEDYSLEMREKNLLEERSNCFKIMIRDLKSLYKNKG